MTKINPMTFAGINKRNRERFKKIIGEESSSSFRNRKKEYLKELKVSINSMMPDGITKSKRRLHVTPLIVVTWLIFEANKKMVFRYDFSLGDIAYLTNVTNHASIINRVKRANDFFDIGDEFFMAVYKDIVVKFNKFFSTEFQEVEEESLIEIVRKLHLRGRLKDDIALDINDSPNIVRDCLWYDRFKFKNFKSLSTKNS